MTHVTARAKVIQDNTGAVQEFPIIVTEQGGLLPLVDYFLEKANARSYSWMQKVVQSVSLLLDYLSVNQHCFSEPKTLFSAFAKRLNYGTIGENGIDPSGLFWLPKKIQNAKQLVLALSEFSDWLSTRLEGQPLNPMTPASQFDELLNWAAYHQRHNRAFLAHAWSRHKESQSSTYARNIQLKRTPSTPRADVKFFPEDKVGDLLFKGFVIPGRQQSPRVVDRLNLRDILITILLHGGGLRVSEPFHLYIHDVQPDPLDPSVAMVRVFHPEEGTAPKDWHNATGKPIECNRSAYLLGKHAMQSRTQYPKNIGLHAGWKSPFLDHQRDLYMHVHWFPRDWGRLFKKLWDAYLLQLIQVERNHPFAFVSFDGKHTGEPYSISSFKEAHARAVQRVGLTVAKMEGTTAHGHRHAYGQRVKTIGDPLVIRAALHHNSLESQLVYTEAQISEISRKLEDATSLLNSGETLRQTLDPMTYGFEDIDPLGLFSGPKPLLKKGSDHDKE